MSDRIQSRRPPAWAIGTAVGAVVLLALLALLFSRCGRCPDGEIRPCACPGGATGRSACIGGARDFSACVCAPVAPGADAASVVADASADGDGSATAAAAGGNGTAPDARAAGANGTTGTDGATGTNAVDGGSNGNGSDRGNGGDDGGLADTGNGRGDDSGTSPGNGANGGRGANGSTAANAAARDAGGATARTPRWCSSWSGTTSSCNRCVINFEFPPSRAPRDVFVGACERMGHGRVDVRLLTIANSVRDLAPDGTATIDWQLFANDAPLLEVNAGALASSAPRTATGRIDDFRGGAVRLRLHLTRCATGSETACGGAGSLVVSSTGW